MKRALMILALAGCTQAGGGTAPSPLPAGENDSCNAARHATVIGQDATALERVLILGKVRLIRPGQAVTMDYWPDRINFMIDANNQITAISCG